jgi:DNA invertase Pin-like site-specific DNA recombinase
MPLPSPHPYIDIQTDTRHWKDAIAYRRVSTDKQGGSGIGIEGQLAAIDRYASLGGLRVVNSYQDVGSGRGRRNLLDRPGLQAAIEVAKATGMPIIVSSLDRLSRDAETIDKIVGEHGLTIISAGDGKMRNPVILASEAARAEREGDLISQRTKEALARKKVEGVLLGNRTNLPDARKIATAAKRQIANDTVQQIVAVLDELAGEVISDRQLVDILNQRQILTSTKRSWTLPAVRRPAKAAREFIKDREARRLERHKKNPNFGRF